jgi:hypothetical protein
MNVEEAWAATKEQIQAEIDQLKMDIAKAREGIDKSALIKEWVGLQKEKVTVATELDKLIEEMKALL